MKLDPSPAGLGYEAKDAPARPLVAVGAGLLAGLGACLLAAAWVCAGPLGPENLAGSFRDGPAEKTSIARDWEQEEASVRAHLQDYGWVDRDAGIVHVPLDRTIELMLREAPPTPEVPR